MAQHVRPTLHLRLTSRSERDGEISLTELARVAEQTQRVVTRIARAMIDDRASGRPRRNIAEATTLSLIGLRSGSTVLDIALPESAADTLSVEDMPSELGEMALAVLVESLEILCEDDPAPVLPVGVDGRVAEDIDDWLRAMRGYSRVTIDAQLSHGAIQAEILPQDARARLRTAESQPSLPYVSADNQALTGRLYALNLRTGTFRIEDDARHSIRLTVPEDVRAEAAQLVNTRVRAFGRASLDQRHRLVSFNVSALEQLPDFIDQTAFFERHDLVLPPRPIEQIDLTQGVITDLSDDEISTFMAALEME
jgi:predicted regulator of amino acid metabolism with ACT domain